MHVLQRKAKATDLQKAHELPEASYDFAAGVWHDEYGLIAYDKCRDASTKKNDVETGEDQKGQ